ncbi:MAG: hypothetical protein ACOZAM_15825 [Pseudomonadota bacterium]
MIEVKPISTDDNTPMPLKVAVEVCFPYGGLTKSALAYAIRRGDLAYEKVGRSYFVTRRDIEKWRGSSRTAAKESKPDMDRQIAELRESLLQGAERLIKGPPIDGASRRPPKS